MGEGYLFSIFLPLYCSNFTISMHIAFIIKKIPQVYKWGMKQHLWRERGNSGGGQRARGSPAEQEKMLITQESS